MHAFNSPLVQLYQCMFHVHPPFSLSTSSVLVSSATRKFNMERDVLETDNYFYLVPILQTVYSSGGVFFGCGLRTILNVLLEVRYYR